MSEISTGVFKTLAYARQAGLGTLAAVGVGKLARRIKSTLDLKRQNFKSAEILVSQQRRDFRLGVNSIDGTISGELSVGGYQNFMESICRQVVQVAVTSGSVITVAAAVTAGAQGTYTCTVINWLTLGFKIGDVITAIGWATTGVPNNGHYAIIIALTATVMTVQFLDGVAMGAKIAGDSVTISTVGKKTWIPSSGGQSRDYYTIEHFFADIAQSEVFNDCVISEMQVKLPASGMATVDFPVLGLGIITNTVEYFTTPTAQPTGGILASVDGLIIVNGVVIAYITAAEITIKGNYSLPGGIVGSNVDPDVFPGVVDVDGSLTILFQDNTFLTYLQNETEVQVVLCLTNPSGAGGTKAPQFTCFNMPRVKIGGASKDDVEKGIAQTVPFTALENIYGGAAVASIDTTISIQDSAFA